MRHPAKKILALGFIAILAIFAVKNRSLLFDVLKDRKKYPTFEKRVEGIHKNYVSKLSSRQRFINLNGGFARLIGQKCCNKIALLKNGMLFRMQYADRTASIQKVTEVFTRAAKEIEALGVPFLYVNFSEKLDRKGELLPDGLTHRMHEASDTLLAGLERNGVNVLDTRPLLVSNVEDVERYFYRTDHHWNARGALRAAPMIARKIGEMLEIPHLDLSLLDEKNWETHVKHDWFLGTEGKRVGRFYGGVEDLIYVTPKFKTEMTVLIPHRNQLRKGTFAATCLEKKFIEKRQNIYKKSAYNVHIGGDFPRVQHLNERGTLPLKVLIVKDSFVLPLQGVLSTIFQDIDVIDLRHFKECSLIEYVRRTRPDIVVMAFNPTVRDDMANKRIKFNVLSPDYTLVSLPMATTLTVQKSTKNAKHYAPIMDQLQHQTTYRLEVGRIDVLEGKTEGVTFALYDPCKKKVHARTLFDIDYLNRHGGAYWEFTVPKTGHWQVVCFAGIEGKTKNISLQCSDLDLKMYQKLENP